MSRKNQQLEPKRPETGLRPLGIFLKRSRTLLLSICAVLLVLFVLLPLGMDRLVAVNGKRSFALSAQKVSILPSQTPDAALTAAALPQEPVSTPVPSEEVQVYNYSLLQLNDNYPAVETLQLRLMELGYLDSDEPSTVYNDATMIAVSMFQRTLDKDMDGVADSELQTRLYSNEASSYEGRLGDTGTDVRGLQSQLTTLGYYTGKVNGYFGIATEEALKAFQKKNGLEEDGVYNVDDRDLIYSTEARPFIDPTPTPKPAVKATAKPTKQPTKTNAPSVTAKPGTATAKPAATEAPQQPNEDAGKDYPTGGSFSASGDVSGLISVAEAQLGKRYVLGDEGPNTFDCSGLVYYCLRQNGVSCSRLSAASFAKSEKWTLISSMSDIVKGDLLFFKNDSVSAVKHVGIYIGGGKMIDASSSRGEVVKRSATSDYWTRNFVCARRVF